VSYQYSGLAVATIEFDLMVPALMAMDAATKTADIKVETVERNRLKAGVCLKLRGNLSDLREAMDVAIRVGQEYGGTLTGKNLIPAPTKDTDLAVRATINK